MKLILCLALTAAVPAAAQSAPPAPAFSALGGFLALSVPDLSASARWYEEKLGLRVTMRPPAMQGISAVILEGGGLIIELIQHPEARPMSSLAPSVTQSVLVHGVFKAGIIVEDLDRTLAVLRERGVEIAFGPYPAREGQRANAIVRDNAGNLIQFFGR